MKVVTDYQNKASEVTPQNGESDLMTSTDKNPIPTNHEARSDSTLANKSSDTFTDLDGSLTEVMSNGSGGSFGVLGAVEEDAKGFESPKLERYDQEVLM